MPAFSEDQINEAKERVRRIMAQLGYDRQQVKALLEEWKEE